MENESSEGKKESLFDRIMNFSCFVKLRPFYVKYREVVMYLFFGGLSFFVSVGSFALFNRALFLNEHASNVLSWIITVAFVYATNKKWVFNSEVSKKRDVFFQVLSFFAGRLGTLAIEEGIIFVFITKMCFNSILIKTAAQVVVIVSNYFISKFIVFRGESK